jgi:hypothetical protein
MTFWAAIGHGLRTLLASYFQMRWLTTHWRNKRKLIDEGEKERKSASLKEGGKILHIITKVLYKVTAKINHL